MAKAICQSPKVDDEKSKKNPMNKSQWKILSDWQIDTKETPKKDPIYHTHRIHVWYIC